MKRFVALVIVALVFGCGVVHRHPPPSPGRTTRLRLTSVKMALKQYRSTYGRFPSGDHIRAIAALTGKTATGENPRGIRFLETEGRGKYPDVNAAGAYLDAWKQPIAFEWDADRRAVVLRSLGKDGLKGTEDDLTETVDTRATNPQP